MAEASYDVMAAVVVVPVPERVPAMAPSSADSGQAATVL